MIDFRRESAVTHPTEGMPLPVLFSSQQDHDTQRLYRLYDFSKSQIIHPDGFCCVAGKVNSADKLYRRWCMNRNWPATNPTHRSITYQERTTMAYRARPSG